MSKFHEVRAHRRLGREIHRFVQSVRKELTGGGVPMMDMQAFQIALDHLVFQVVLYLFVGAILMLVRNELRPGMSEGRFALGMVLWPFWIGRGVLLALLIAIRGVRG